MLSLPSIVKIYLHASPVNLHYAFDRLAGIVRDEMGHDPLTGHLFVFRNRRGDRVKLLFWYDDGWAIYYKRLEKGIFKFPFIASDTRSLQVSVSDLSLLLCVTGHFKTSHRGAECSSRVLGDVDNRQNSYASQVRAAVCFG